MSTLVSAHGVQKDKYLRTWGYVLGTPEAEQAWEAKLELDERTSRGAGSSAHQIYSDIEPYRSPLDGSMVTSRSQHRDHMRKHGVIEMGNEYPKERRSENSVMPRAGYDIVRAMERA